MQTKVTDALYQETIYEYDTRNNLIHVIPPLTGPDADYFFSYDVRNRLATKKIPGMSSAYDYEYYDSNDLLRRSTDANGNKITYNYDIYGRTDKVYLGPTLMQNYNYAEEYGFTDIRTGKLIDTWARFTEGIGNATTGYTYDNFGRAYKEVVGSTVGGDGITYSFNHADWVLTESHSIGGSGGNLTYSYGYTYDDFGRVDVTTHQIQNEPPVMLSKKKYNDWDGIIFNGLNGLNGGVRYLDAESFSYTPRGWLKSINNVVPERTNRPLCGLPLESGGGAGNQLEIDATLEDIIGLVTSGDQITIDGTDPCVDADCFIVVCDYIAQSSCCIKSINEIYVDGTPIPLSQPTYLVDAGDYTGDIELLESEIMAWLDNNGYLYSNVSILPNRGAVTIRITGTDANFQYLVSYFYDTGDHTSIVTIPFDSDKNACKPIPCTNEESCTISVGDYIALEVKILDSLQINGEIYNTSIPYNFSDINQHTPFENELRTWMEDRDYHLIDVQLVPTPQIGIYNLQIEGASATFEYAWDKTDNEVTSFTAQEVYELECDGSNDPEPQEIQTQNTSVQSLDAFINSRTLSGVSFLLSFTKRICSMAAPDGIFLTNWIN